MKISAYTPQVNLNTSNARENVTMLPEAFGANQSGAKAVASALNNTVDMMTREQEQKTTVAVADANNQYNMRINTLLHDPEKGLLNAQGKNAEAIMGQYQAEEKKIREDVMKNAGLDYNRAQQLFNVMADRSMTTTSEGIQNYQQAQHRVHLGTVLENTLNTEQNLFLTGPKTREAMQSSIGNVATQYKLFGPQIGWDEDKVKQETRKATDALVESGLQQAVGNKNFDQANLIIGNAAGFVDEASLMKYRAAVNDLQTKADSSNLAKQALQMFPNDPQKATDWVMQNMPKRSANGGAGVDKGLDAGWNAWGNQRMDNGRVGCAEAVGKIGGYYSPFLAQESKDGIAYVPTMVKHASQEGGPGVIPFDASKLQKGDCIVYGDDDHIVIADGKGGYIGNSSDANGGQGATVHGSDYTEMNGLQPTKIIKTGSAAAGGQEATPLNDELLREQAEAAVNAQYSLVQRQKSIKMGNVRKEMHQTLLANPDWSTAEQLGYVRQLAGDDVDLQDGLFTMIHSLQNNLKAEAKAAEREAKAAARAGETDVHNIKVLYERGYLKNKQEATDFMSRTGQTYSESQILSLDKYFNDKDNGTGIQVDEYMSTLKKQLGVSQEVWDEWKPSMKVLLKQKISDYQKENGGNSPGFNDVIEMGRDLATQQSTGMIGNYGFLRDDVLSLSPVQVKSWGYTGYEPLPGTNYIRFYKENNQYVDVATSTVWDKIQSEKK